MENLNPTKEQVRKQKIIDLVCSQTDYTREEAEEKLKNRNYNYLDVIKDYLNPNRKPVQETKTLNQKIFSNIRSFMDNGSKELLRQKEYYKKAREMSFEKKVECIVQNKQNKIETTSLENDKNKKNIINI